MHVLHVSIPWKMVHNVRDLRRKLTELHRIMVPAKPCRYGRAKSKRDGESRGIAFEYGFVDSVSEELLMQLQSAFPEADMSVEEENR